MTPNHNYRGPKPRGEPCIRSLRSAPTDDGALVNRPLPREVTPLLARWAQKRARTETERSSVIPISSANHFVVFSSWRVSMPGQLFIGRSSLLSLQLSSNFFSSHITRKAAWPWNKTAICLCVFCQRDKPLNNAEDEKASGREGGWESHASSFQRPSTSLKLFLLRDESASFSALKRRLALACRYFSEP